MQPARPLLRNLTLVASVVSALVLLLIPGGSARAAPSRAEVERQIRVLNEKVDALSAQYNIAQKDLKESRTRQAQLQRRVEAAARNVDAAQAKVSVIGASAYRDSRVGPWSSLLESDSPQVFLDKMTMLEQLSLEHRDAINDAIEAKEDLDAAKAPVDAEVIKQVLLENSLRDRRAALAKDLKTWEKIRAQLPPIPGWVAPLRGPITTYFAMRWGVFHPGLDIAAPTGTRVRAASSGVVQLARWYGGYGYAVIIDHGNGVTSLYGHNSSLAVSRGEKVQAGQVISRVGTTGFSTGPHLHFGISVNDSEVNPLTWLARRGVYL